MTALDAARAVAILLCLAIVGVVSAGDSGGAADAAVVIALAWLAATLYVLGGRR